MSNESVATLWGAFIGGIIGIIAVIVSYWLNRSISLEIIQTTNFSKAAADLQCAFTNEIRIVEDSQFDNSTPRTYFVKIFNDAYVRHHNAVIRFKPYLSKSDRIEIEKAWDNHCWDNNFENKMYVRYKFSHYEFRQGIGTTKKDPTITKDTSDVFMETKRRIKANIEDILSFAKLG